MTAISVGSRAIGPGAPCFVIAEIGVNHNGDVELAHALIDACAEAGVDSVKFQTFVPEALAAASAPKAEYQKAGDRAVTQLEMLARLALPRDAHEALRDHARARGVEFLSSPFDEGSVDLLDELGVEAFKVPSGEVTNHALLRRIAGTGKAILMSTGMCTMDEIEAAVAAMGSTTGRLALLHCVSRYPTPPADCNLRAMETLRGRFAVPVGWSDHTEGTAIAIAAAALGANVLEKHVTLCRELPGPDHRASIEPRELRAMVAAIRDVESALGDGTKRPVAGEQETARVARKSLHYRRTLRTGHVLTEADLVALRPGSGIPPARLDQVVGRSLSREVYGGAMVSDEDLSGGGTGS